MAAHAQDEPQNCRPRIERIIDFIAVIGAAYTNSHPQAGHQ